MILRKFCYGKASANDFSCIVIKEETPGINFTLGKNGSKSLLVLVIKKMLENV